MAGLDTESAKRSDHAGGTGGAVVPAMCESACQTLQRELHRLFRELAAVGAKIPVKRVGIEHVTLYDCRRQKIQDDAEPEYLQRSTARSYCYSGKHPMPEKHT